MWILKQEGRWAPTINLAQDRCQRQDLLNTTLSLRVLKDVDNTVVYCRIVFGVNPSITHITRIIDLGVVHL